MASVNVNIRMDADLKKQAEELFEELGLNMTTAFNAFVRQSVREQRIPFMLSKNVISLNEETIQAIEEVERLKKDTNKKVYSSFAELLEEVKADV